MCIHIYILTREHLNAVCPAKNGQGGLDRVVGSHLSLLLLGQNVVRIFRTAAGQRRHRNVYGGAYYKGQQLGFIYSRDRIMYRKLETGFVRKKNSILTGTVENKVYDDNNTHERLASQTHEKCNDKIIYSVNIFTLFSIFTSYILRLDYWRLHAIKPVFDYSK